MASRFFIITKDLTMIFEIEENVPIDATTKSNLWNLLEAHYLGYHIVAFEKYSLISDKMNKLFSEEPNMLRVIKAIKENKHNISSLKDFCCMYVKVVNNTQEYQEYEKDGQRIIKVPIKYFDVELSKCFIISEDISDGNFYLSMLYYAQQKNYYSIPQDITFQCEVDNGGGSNTFKVFKQRILEKKVTLCIVDSDRKSSLEDIRHDTTSGRVQNLVEEFRSCMKIATHYILKVREKENLVRPSQYLEYPSFSHYKGLQHLQQFENTQDEIYLGYVKLSRDSLFKSDELACTSLSITSDLRGIGKDGLQEFAEAKFYTSRFKKDRFIHAESVGDEIDLFSKIPDYLQEDYEEIVKNVFSHTCSYKRVKF